MADMYAVTTSKVGAISGYSSNMQKDFDKMVPVSWRICAHGLYVGSKQNTHDESGKMHFDTQGGFRDKNRKFNMYAIQGLGRVQYSCVNIEVGQYLIGNDNLTKAFKKSQSLKCNVFILPTGSKVPQSRVPKPKKKGKKGKKGRTIEVTKL